MGISASRLAMTAFGCLALATPCLASSYDWLMAFERLGTGCSEKVVRVGDHDISYNDCGDHTGEPVLFVHGFGADKDIWNRLIKDIDCKFHMIAIDLPGWGKSSFISGQDYGVQQNAGRIDSFRTAIGIDSWHVVGWSMGGTTSATYALRYPERVRSVTLMDTGGFRLPAFAEGKPDPIEAAKVLLVKNREDFDRTLEMAFANPPWLPGFARNIAAEHLIARGPAQSEMLPRVMVDITSLSSTFKDYKGALQVIWGQEDRMMDKSVMSTIKDMHPDAVTHIIEGCGHSPLMEKPSESAKLISDFITAIKAKPTH